MVLISGTYSTLREFAIPGKNVPEVVALRFVFCLVPKFWPRSAVELDQCSPYWTMPVALRQLSALLEGNGHCFDGVKQQAYIGYRFTAILGHPALSSVYFEFLGPV
jgi:hypothetical protein